MVTAAASVQKGGTLQFSAVVDGTGLDGDPAYRNVAWSITTSGVKAETAIDTAGVLTMAADEEHTSLTIQAVSALNSGNSGTATVTVTRAQAVNSITVTAAASVQRGGTLQFSAAVTGTGLDGAPAYKAVTWSITTGGVKAGTVIDTAGKLTVAADEEHTSLTIKAVSVLDSGKSGSTAVTLTGGEALQGVALADLANHVAGLPANSAGSPHTVKLAPVNIRENGVMAAINQAVMARYITLDLSVCSARNNTIGGSYESHGNDGSIFTIGSGEDSSTAMNVIKDNAYIVGISSCRTVLPPSEALLLPGAVALSA
jgi:hypothetical protein